MSATTADCAAGHVTINMLPNDILLLIFHFDRMTHVDKLAVVNSAHLRWRWHRLIHVCQRWRSIVFRSPKFLDLALVCDPSTPVELIDIWPPLPIIIRDRINRHMPKDYAFQVAIAHLNHVRQIDLCFKSRSQLQRLASAMQKEFPALIHLSFDSDKFVDEFDDDSALAIPDGFLGESASCLQSLNLDFIAFPVLPKFLLSATTALVRLTLQNIPDYGYFPPEAILTGLAVLVNLKYLTIGFGRPRSFPNQESCHPPPPTCAVLPALTFFKFQGASKYLDELMAGIDTPLLDSLYITFFNHFIFDISQLAQFMRRTTRIQTPNEAHVDFNYCIVKVESLSPTWTLSKKSGLSITCVAFNWELSNLVQVLMSLFPSIYIVEHLYVYRPRSFPLPWQDPMQWLEVFHPFTAVKKLYVIKEFAQHIAPALQELVGERAKDVLPTMESLFLEGLLPSGPVQEAIGQFVAARQLIGHPVAISCWKNYQVATSFDEQYCGVI